MEETKKEYSVIGTVTIGTDEYKDLITDRFEAEKEKDKWYNKWYDEYCARGRFETECKELKEELNKLKKFISKNKALIDEDSITIFMSMFGEE